MKEHSLDNAFFKQILESIEDYAVFTTDCNGNISSWNKGAENVLGYTEQEIIGKPAQVIFTEQDILEGAPQHEATEALRKGKGTDERYHQRKDGSLFWGSGLVFPLYDDKDQHIGFTKVMRNLSHRKEAEDTLVEAKKYAESIVETSREPIVILNIDLTINSASKAFYKLFNISKDVKEQLIYTVLSSNINTVPFEQHMEQFDDFQDLELLFKRSESAQTGTLLVSCRKVFRTFNSVGQFLLTFDDVTDFRNDEQAREHFVGVASHELKTPITIIKSYAQILSMEIKGKMNGRVDTIVDHISNQSDKLLKLTSSLLDATAFKTGMIKLAKERFVLLDLVLEQVQDFEANSCRIVVEQVSGETIYADRMRIGQVINNLLSNAVKYSPDDKEIVISLETNAEKSHIKTVVSDHGIGISSEKRQDLFKKFSRLHNLSEHNIDGFGMGLYICAEIIALHNGIIGVEANPPEGSSFYFDLPIQ